MVIIFSQYTNPLWKRIQVVWQERSNQWSIVYMLNGYFPHNNKAINNSTSTFHTHKIKSRMINDHGLNGIHLPLLMINGYLLLLLIILTAALIYISMHGSRVSGKKGSNNSVHRKARHLHSLIFLCYFWESIWEELLCKVWNYWVRIFFELRCQLYQAKLRCQLKTWNLE